MVNLEDKVLRGDGQVPLHARRIVGARKFFQARVFAHQTEEQMRRCNATARLWSPDNDPAIIDNRQVADGGTIFQGTDAARSRLEDRLFLGAIEDSGKVPDGHIRAARQAEVRADRPLVVECSRR